MVVIVILFEYLFLYVLNFVTTLTEEDGLPKFMFKHVILTLSSITFFWEVLDVETWIIVSEILLTL